MKKYSANLLAHFKRFVEQHQLLDPLYKNPLSLRPGTMWIGVSGGPDSMMLAFALHWLKSKVSVPFELKAIFIDHGHRPKIDLEWDVVQSFLDTLCIPVIKVNLHLSSSPNFEHVARQKRYEAFRGVLGPDDLLALGHHLDDSYEWHLMSLFKSLSNPRMGIALKRGPFIRPLMCLSKRQILNICKEEKIVFINDPSNECLDYERNYVRNQLVPIIKRQYPNYLRNYVYQANSWANNESAKKKSSDLFEFKDALGMLVLAKKDFKETTFQSSTDIKKILAIIKKLSVKERGSLAIEVQKCVLAQAKGKKGPHAFSGGVYCLMSRRSLRFFRAKDVPMIKHHINEMIARCLDGRTSQIPFFFDLFYPFYFRLAPTLTTYLHPFFTFLFGPDASLSYSGSFEMHSVEEIMTKLRHQMPFRPLTKQNLWVYC